MLTPHERRYCELAREYQATEDPQNAHAIDEEMMKLEAKHPDTVAVLAAQYTDEGLIALLEAEENTR